MEDVDLNSPGEFEGLPGGDLVCQGLKDLHAGLVTEQALLVLVAGPRLRGLGIAVPERSDIPRPYEHRLYEELTRTHSEAAYSRYNSLLRRVVSFARALAQERGSSAERV